MDADYDPSQQTASKKKKKKERNKMKKEDLPQMGKKRKKSHFAEAITKNKPVFDPRKSENLLLSNMQYDVCDKLLSAVICNYI